MPIGGGGGGCSMPMGGGGGGKPPCLRTPLGIHTASERERERERESFGRFWGGAALPRMPPIGGGGGGGCIMPMGGGGAKPMPMPAPDSRGFAIRGSFPTREHFQIPREMWTVELFQRTLESTCPFVVSNAS